ncbi:nurim-like [Styela clava]
MKLRSRPNFGHADYSDNEDITGQDVNNNNNNSRTHRIRDSMNMKIKKTNKKTDIFVTYFSTAIALSSLFYLLYTTSLFVYFLSSNSNGILNLKIQKLDVPLSHVLIQDIVLLMMFILQHTVMAAEWFKNVVSYVIPRHIYRCFYNLATGLAIQVLTSSWLNVVPYSNLFLWDYSNCISCQIICQSLHVVAWIHTISALYMLDFSEFMGLKQVYYEANQLGCPLHAKTSDAQRFLGNFRHATVSGLLIIFWLVPCMTIDRLILASAFTVYIFSTNADNEDYVYVQSMFYKKKESLYSKK